VVEAGSGQQDRLAAPLCSCHRLLVQRHALKVPTYGDQADRAVALGSRPLALSVQLGLQRDRASQDGMALPHLSLHHQGAAQIDGGDRQDLLIPERLCGRQNALIGAHGRGRAALIVGDATGQKLDPCVPPLVGTLRITAAPQAAEQRTRLIEAEHVLMGRIHPQGACVSVAL
jgi:hypothetical protein